MRHRPLALFFALLPLICPALAQSFDSDAGLLRRLERMDQRRQERQAQSHPRAGSAFPEGSPQDQAARRLSARLAYPRPSAGLGVEEALLGEPSARLPPPAGAKTRLDIAYGSDPQQRLDVYAPAGASRAPVIFMVHGGGWTRGDKAMSRVVENKVGSYLPKGYGVISINYRMSDSPDPLAQARDVAQALAFAQANAPSWGLDPSRFVLMGHSAGAHLIALLSADPSEAFSLGAKPWLGSIPLDSAALDLDSIMRAPHMRLYDPVFGSDPERWARASPLSRLKSAIAPMLLVCSSHRRESCAQAESFASKARSYGARAATLRQALSHSQINMELGVSGPYTQAVDAFLRSLGLP